MSPSTSSKASTGKHHDEARVSSKDPGHPLISTDPHGSTHSLQRSAGNYAVNQLFSSGLKDREHVSDGIPPIVEDVLTKSAGHRLSPDVQSSMESHFGEELGGVRLHTDGLAAASATALNAAAYTVGDHLVFGANEFAPGTPLGRAVLAHELAHVVQQRRAGSHTRPGIGRAGDVYERAADAAAGLGTFGVPSAENGEGFVSRGNDSASAPPIVQRLTLEERKRHESGFNEDQFRSGMIRAGYSNLSERSTETLVNNALELDIRFQFPQSPLVRLEAARALIKVYETLRARDVGLESFPPFTEEDVPQWFTAAGLPSPHYGRLPGPSSISSEVTTHDPTDLEKASKSIEMLAMFEEQQESLLGTIGQHQTGGGPDVENGLRVLKGTTLGQLKSVVTRNIGRGTQLVPQPEDKVNLLDVSGQIWYVANQVYLLDRSGHIVPGEFHFEFNALSLDPGVYFYSPFMLNTASGETLPSNAMIKVDGPPTVVGRPVLSVPRMNTQFLPLTTQGRNVLREKAGISLVVAPIGHPLTEKYKLLQALLDARHHMWWAIRTEVLLRINNWREHPGDELLLKAYGEALGKLANTIPQVRAALTIQRVLDEVHWLASTMKIAVYARTEGEIDIAGQAIARKLAAEAIDLIKGKLEAKAKGRVEKAFQKRTAPGAAGESEDARPPAQQQKSERQVPEDEIPRTPKDVGSVETRGKPSPGEGVVPKAPAKPPARAETEVPRRVKQRPVEEGAPTAKAENSPKAKEEVATRSKPVPGKEGAARAKTELPAQTEAEVPNKPVAVEKDIPKPKTEPPAKTEAEEPTHPRPAQIEEGVPKAKPKTPAKTPPKPTPAEIEAVERAKAVKAELVPAEPAPIEEAVPQAKPKTPAQTPQEATPAEVELVEPAKAAKAEVVPAEPAPIEEAVPKAKPKTPAQTPQEATPAEVEAVEPAKAAQAEVVPAKPAPIEEGVPSVKPKTPAKTPLEATPAEVEAVEPTKAPEAEATPAKPAPVEDGGPKAKTKRKAKGKATPAEVKKVEPAKAAEAEVEPAKPAPAEEAVPETKTKKKTKTRAKAAAPGPIDTVQAQRARTVEKITKRLDAIKQGILNDDAKIATVKAEMDETQGVIRNLKKQVISSQGALRAALLKKLASAKDLLEGQTTNYLTFVEDKKGKVKRQTILFDALKSETYSRPPFQSGMRLLVWKLAQAASPDGIVRDPSKKPINFDDPWVMGHQPGFEFWKHAISAAQRGISRAKFIQEHNTAKNYRPETAETNSSHKYEAADEIYLGF